MNSSARPTTAPAPLPTSAVPPLATQPQTPSPTSAPRPAPQPDQEDEATSQARRDFYAWCAGCEGYGSIF